MRTLRQRELDELRERQGDDLRFLELREPKEPIATPALPTTRRDRELLELELRHLADQFRTDDLAAAIEVAAPLVTARLARSFVAEVSFRHDLNFGDPQVRAEQRLSTQYPPPLDPAVKNDLQTYGFLVTLADQIAADNGRRS
jgi:hypothetical protein